MAFPLMSIVFAVRSSIEHLKLYSKTRRHYQRHDHSNWNGIRKYLLLKLDSGNE